MDYRGKRGDDVFSCLRKPNRYEGSLKSLCWMDGLIYGRFPMHKTGMVSRSNTSRNPRWHNAAHIYMCVAMRETKISLTEPPSVHHAPGSRDVTPVNHMAVQYYIMGLWYDTMIQVWFSMFIIVATLHRFIPWRYRFGIDVI